MVKNILTFDIEEWYQCNFRGIDLSRFARRETSLESTIDKIIELCRQHNIKSTFFIVGELAKRKPQLVKKLYINGHEIASHSYDHKLIYKMGAKLFKKDLTMSCAILEDLIGEKVIGFRAPSWSLKRESLSWYYDVLDEAGIKYSSSIFPGQAFIYGISNFFHEMHYPVINGKKIDILEIPAPTMQLFGYRMGYSGGIYFRFLPIEFIKRKILTNNRNGRPVFLYLHPRELEDDNEMPDLPVIERFLRFAYAKKNLKRLQDLLNHFTSNCFMLMRDLL